MNQYKDFSEINHRPLHSVPSAKIAPTVSWPPPYIWRSSPRARRVSMRISEAKGLELVSPMGVSEQEALDFLEKHRSWVEKHSNIIQRANEPLDFPTEINLSAIDRTWFIKYVHLIGHRRSKLFGKFSEDYLTVTGDTSQLEPVLKVMRNCLRVFAHDVLQPWLDELSQKYKLPYRSMRIKQQKSIWGSCSSADDITLNYKLLFLSPAVVNYILIHELCHTKVRNHSPRFWNLVGRYCEDYVACKRQLKIEAQQLPQWLIS